MTAHHTPGPWKFGHMMDGERWWVGQEYDRLPVAFVDRHDWPESVVDANLRLIAAAPDLLEACLAVNKCGNGGAKLSRAASDKVRAAILKTEGK